MKKVPLQPVAGLTESRKAKSLYRWLSKVTGVDACWLEGTGQDGSPAWAVIKRIAGTALYLLRSSLWRKTALASLLAAPLLFSPAKLKAQHTAIIEDYMVGTPHGFQVSGASDNDFLGRKNTLAIGDINGDGIDDLILGAHYADANGSNAGEAYVIFGSTGTFSSSFELTDLDGSDGFVIAGIAAGNDAGRSVASGDINGDGYDEVIVGAPNTYYNKFSSSGYDFNGSDGAVYVIFGSSAAFADTVQLSSLGSDGFVVRGGTFDRIGYSLATGDVNGDGFDDLITGGEGDYDHAYYEYNYDQGSGYRIYSEAFVVFGDSAITDTVRISGLDGSDGFKMHEYYGWYDFHFGSQVTSGDLDGDGYDEVIFSSRYNDNSTNAGTTHVIFGQSSGFGSDIDVETMDASTGFRLFGFGFRYHSGSALATVDVDGDGTDDLLIGADESDVNASHAGQTYVVFGNTNGFASDIDLSSLDGTTGFTLNGIEGGDLSGSSLAVGDINADGINDIIIGARGGDRTNPTTNSSGDVYVVFGQSSGFSSVFELSSLDESTGFTLQGQSANDQLGSELLVADFDGNNRDELIIGASSAEPDGGSDNGTVYVFTQPVLEQEITGDEGFRTLSAPASGTLFDNLLDDFWTQGFTGADSSGAAFDDNVWTWDTDTQAWTPLTNLNTNSLDEAQGFLFYIYSDDNGLNTSGNAGFPKNLSTLELFPETSETLEFNSGTVTPVDDLNPGDFFFAGNPYLYPIDWDVLSKNGMFNAVYVYDDANAQWQSWNGSLGGLTDGIIAPFQGFFTQANLAGSGGSLVIEEGDTVSTSASLLKMATPRVLKLTAEAGDLTTNAWLSFQQGGEVGRDDFDALALQSLAATWLRLATVISTQDVLQINALPPDQGEELRFPLELSGTVDAQTATLSLEELEAFEGWTLELHDLETGDVYPLSADTKLSVPIEQIHARQASVLQPGSPVAVHAKTNGHRYQLALIPAITVHNEPVNDVPTVVELQQNYPNPFNPSTTIEYGVPEAGAVTLEVFDVMGRKVATLVGGETMQPGRYLIRFDASQLASGMYLYRLQTGAVTLTRKLTLIK